MICFFSDHFFDCILKIGYQSFLHIGFQKIPKRLYFKPFRRILDEVGQKNDHDPRFFFPKSPRQIDAAEVSHIDIQNRDIVPRKVFDRTGIIKQVKPHLHSIFCAMLLEQL